MQESIELKMSPVTREEYLEWKNSPITKAFFAGIFQNVKEATLRTMKTLQIQYSESFDPNLPVIERPRRRRQRIRPEQAMSP